MYRVKTLGLHVRQGPGKEYPILDAVPQGTILQPLETTGWLPVLLHGTVGWVSRRCLEKVQEPTPAKVRYDFSSRDGVITAIRAECEKQGLCLPQQAAYVLATAEWETNRTFAPVREAYWLSEDWRRANLRYYPYYGRGFVQLTWEANYRKYSKILGIDLTADPDKALEPEIALFILVHGFKNGTFTGKKLSDYINEAGCDFIQARRCINALNKAEEIAALAEKYLPQAAAPPTTAITEWPWLAIARRELGVKEVPGKDSNRRILAYLKSTTLGSPENDNDETHWCSAFVNWVLKQAKIEPRTNSAWARSWLNWGVATDNPIPGTIVVFARGPNGGHVAFYLDEDDCRVQVLGGNQSDAVTITWYAKENLLGYREPEGWADG